MENITIFAVIIRANILFGILGASPKEYYSMEILDKTDLQILRVLQNNSRLTTKELAAKVNLSPTPVFERVKRLEANGYVKKYVAVLDPAKLNRGFVVFCSVKLRRLNRDIAAEFTRIGPGNPGSDRVLQHFGRLRLSAQNPCSRYEILSGVYYQCIRYDREHGVAHEYFCHGRGEA